MLVLLAACSGIRHGATIGDYLGQTLVARDGPGAKRLEIEMAYDATVRNMVAQYGTPDYILVESNTRLRLAYLMDDRVLLFERRVLQRMSHVMMLDPIPADFALLFTRADQDKLAEIRRFKNAQKATPTPKRGSARGRKKR
jgi:hypothetical protein